MSRASSPFRPAVVLGMLLVGAAAFLMLLYALGAGMDGQSERNGTAHAESNGLNGYSALVSLLEAQGYEVDISRSAESLNEENLLILTPDSSADPEALNALMGARKYQGPTLLILPKWSAFAAPESAKDVKDGWVTLAGVSPPQWAGDVNVLDRMEMAFGATAGWEGLGLSGTLPEPDQVMAATNPDQRLYPLVRDKEGDVLAGYWNQNGYFPVLAAAAGVSFTNLQEEYQDKDAWPVVVVIEPDLMNNYGLADQRRAQLAATLVATTLEEYDLPIVFDLTVPGPARSQNLLTLAFSPPFLAATLCLLLASLVIGWRAFRRFGPPFAEIPAMAQGKRQLARNGAALIERARRLHLLGAPYAALMAGRMADALGIRDKDPDTRELAIEKALNAKGLDSFITRAQAMRSARKPQELLRAARALKTLERTLTK